MVTVRFWASVHMYVVSDHLMFFYVYKTVKAKGKRKKIVGRSKV